MDNSTAEYNDSVGDNKWVSILFCHSCAKGQCWDSHLPSEEFELTADSLGAHMEVTESSPGMGHGELILRTFI